MVPNKKAKPIPVVEEEEEEGGVPQLQPLPVPLAAAPVDPSVMQLLLSVVKMVTDVKTDIAATSELQTASMNLLRGDMDKQGQKSKLENADLDPVFKSVAQLSYEFTPAESE